MVPWRKIKQGKEIKNVPAMQETQVHSLGWEDPLEKEMATHSGILAWRIPWTEEPGGLQFPGSQRVGHGWVTNSFTFKENRMWWIEWRMLFCTEMCVWECISDKWRVCKSGGSEEEFHVDIQKEQAEGTASTKTLGWIVRFTAKRLAWGHLEQRREWSCVASES